MVFTAAILVVVSIGTVCLTGVNLLLAIRIRKLELQQDLVDRSITDLRDVDRTLHGILHGLRDILEQWAEDDADASAYGDDDNSTANGGADSIANAQFLPSPSEWKGGIGVECEPIHWEPGPAKPVFTGHGTLDEE